jgi:hypothetical protein
MRKLKARDILAMFSADSETVNRLYTDEQYGQFGFARPYSPTISIAQMDPSATAGQMLPTTTGAHWYQSITN